LDGKFGNALLDAALTGTAWKYRILGVNRTAEARLYMTWYATGNNVAVAADAARRICHCRLESPEERPEERGGVRHPELLAWVGDDRGRLLAAALRAFLATKAPAAAAFQVPRRRYLPIVFRADLEAAGIAYRDDAGLVADFHSLRHTFITNLARG